MKKGPLHSAANPIFSHFCSFSIFVCFCSSTHLNIPACNILSVSPVLVIFHTMQNRMKDIRFITLPEDRELGSVTVRKDIPLPIQFPEGSVTDDIDVNSIVAGLIKTVAWDTENKNYNYYKDLLLDIQPDVVKELNLAAIAQSKKEDFEFAEELMLAVNRLSLGRLSRCLVARTTAYIKRANPGGAL